jgi:hypothetical protein
VVGKIRAAGGEVFAISSEPQHLANQAHEHWGLNFDNIGDPHQEIPRVCDERDWLTLYANRGDTEFLQRGANWTVEHPKGFFQPGVLAVTQSSRILYRWRSVPSDKNLNGTVARPTADHVWRSIDASLREGDAAGHSAHDDNPEVDSGPPPVAVFMAALIANGWFLRVKSFVYSPGVASTPARLKKALSRWPPFIIVWLAAFGWLPTLWVSIGLVSWLVWIVMDIRSAWGRMDIQEEIKPSR